MEHQTQQLHGALSDRSFASRDTAIWPSPPPPPSIPLLAPLLASDSSLPLASHTRSRVSTACSPPPPSSFSLSLVYIRMLSVYGLSASLAPEPRSSLLTLALPFTCAPHNAFSSRLSPLGVCIFFISLSLSSVHRFFALPLLIEKERERRREWWRTLKLFRAIVPLSFAPSVLPRGTVRVVGCETIAKCKWIRDIAERERDRRIL